MNIEIRRIIAISTLCILIWGAFFSIPTNKVVSTQQNFYFLDAGHGIGHKCGYKSVVDLKEEDGCFWEYKQNFEVRAQLAKKLDSVGIMYVFVNQDSIDYPLTNNMSNNDAYKLDGGRMMNRVDFINNFNTKLPKVVISIHANAPGSTNAQGEPYTKSQIDNITGFSAFIPKTVGVNQPSYKEKLSKKMGVAYAKYCKEIFPDHKFRQSSDRGYFTKDYAMIKHPKAACIITENEFFTSEPIRDKMRDSKFDDAVAHVHFLMIMELEK